MPLRGWRNPIVSSRSLSPSRRPALARFVSALALGGALASAALAPARANPLDSGPIADFINVFKTQAIPRETVAYAGKEKPGTIVISTSQRRLYYVLGGGAAIRYGVGVGRQGFSWSGVKTVQGTKEWPACR
ncbi:L,D-transpeptidase, partial [Methylobacterium sp. NPDC097213]|uniref:L,D-transpeptidase n=1 Tax=Methylobacterium sp. NPDC097213 TaxID=3364170 RepID=UPI00383BB823